MALSKVGLVTIGNAAAEDRKIIFDGNAQDWHIGIDDSADDLTIGLGSTLGTTSHIVIDEAGCVTKPLQPAFQVTPSSSQDNISSDTTIIFGTEIFDKNADFASNTFTAPVTGSYQFNAMIGVNGIDSAFQWIKVSLVTSNRTYGWMILDVDKFFNADSNNTHTLNAAILADMDASDTAYIKWEHGGGTDQADIAAGIDYTTFSGYLVA